MIRTTGSVFYEIDNGVGVQYLEGFCNKDDTKPTAGIATGSNLIEVDTGDWYFFDEDSSTWTKLCTIE